MNTSLTFTSQSAQERLLLISTQFRLIHPEEFSGSSLTQQWNVGVNACRFPLPTSTALQRHSFSCAIMRQEIFVSGSCACPASWWAKTCHLGSHSVWFVRCWDHCRLSHSEPTAPIVTRVPTGGQACRAADDIPRYWKTEVSTTTCGTDSQECD